MIKMRYTKFLPPQNFISGFDSQGSLTQSSQMDGMVTLTPIKVTAGHDVTPPKTPSKNDSFDAIVDRFYSDEIKAEVSLR